MNSNISTKKEVDEKAYNLSVLVTENYWVTKEPIVSLKIYCDYVSFRCNKKEVMEFIIGIYEVFCHAFEKIPKNVKVKVCYNYFPKKLERENIRKFPTVTFYQIYTYLSSSCYLTTKFPFTISSNAKSQENLYDLFLWMLKLWNEHGKFSCDNIYSTLKSLCLSKNLLKTKSELVSN